jgi:hypothetical protein
MAIIAVVRIIEAPMAVDSCSKLMWELLWVMFEPSIAALVATRWVAGAWQP